MFKNIDEQKAVESDTNANIEELDKQAEVASKAAISPSDNSQNETSDTHSATVENDEYQNSIREL